MWFQLKNVIIIQDFIILQKIYNYYLCGPEICADTELNDFNDFQASTQ